MPTYNYWDGKLTPVPEPEPKIGWHATAIDEKGSGLIDRTYSDMDVSADFNPPNGLVEAEEWALRVLESDDRADHVSIRESVQERPGECWKVGRFVKTVRRND